MDIYSLKIFLRASETLNFTKTAQEFYLAQPVISRRIRDLESEFGCQLFARSSHGVALTEEGKLLVPAVKDALNSLDHGMEQVKNRIRSRTKEISIGAITPATNTFLPSVIGEYSISHPDVSVDVQRMVPKQIVEGIELGSHDIFLSSEDDLSACSEWESCNLRSDEIGLIVRKREPIDSVEEARKVLAKSRVYGIPLEDSPTLTGIAHKILTQLGLSQIEIEEVRPIESLMFNIASGLGVSILPDNIVNLDAFDLKFVSLGTDVRLQMRMVWRPDAPLQVREFAELVKKRIQTIEAC